MVFLCRGVLLPLSCGRRVHGEGQPLSKMRRMCQPRALFDKRLCPNGLGQSRSLGHRIPIERRFCKLLNATRKMQNGSQ